MSIWVYVLSPATVQAQLSPSHLLLEPVEYLVVNKHTHTSSVSAQRTEDLCIKLSRNSDHGFSHAQAA
jgi:hypothetical protein